MIPKRATTPAAVRLVVQRYLDRAQTEQQQCELKHHREALDGEAEVPLLETVQLPLSVPTLVGSRTSTVPEVQVDPLLSEHREKRGEE